MGMFDSIMIKCPTCGTEIECQSKSGECTLRRMSLEEAVETGDDALCDVNRHAPFKCSECGELWRVKLKYDAVVIPESSYVEDED